MKNHKNKPLIHQISGKSTPLCQKSSLGNPTTHLVYLMNLKSTAILKNEVAIKGDACEKET